MQKSQFKSINLKRAAFKKRGPNLNQIILYFESSFILVLILLLILLGNLIIQVINTSQSRKTAKKSKPSQDADDLTNLSNTTSVQQIMSTVVNTGVRMEQLEMDGLVIPCKNNQTMMVFPSVCSNP